MKNKLITALLSLMLVSCAPTTPTVPTALTTVSITPTQSLPIPTTTTTPTALATYSVTPIQLLSTPTSSYICLSTANQQIILICNFYNATHAGAMEVAYSKYTCQNMIAMQNNINADPEEILEYMNTYFDWYTIDIDQVTEQNLENDGTWYGLQFIIDSETITHRLFIEDFDSKPCINIEKSTGIPMSTPINP